MRICMAFYASRYLSKLVFKTLTHCALRQDPYAAVEEAAGPPVDGQRRVRLGPSAANGGFPGNSVRTSKYNIITFLPIFLFTMFSRVAYLYFAAQARPPAAPSYLINMP